MNLHPLIFILATALTVSCTSSAKAPEGTLHSSPDADIDSPASTNKHDALWNIMSSCVKGFRATGSPAPCMSVNIASGIENGFVVLKDMKGDSHFLVIPTRKIQGIEDSTLASTATTNYWQEAYQNLSYVDHALGRQLPSGALAIGVNSVYARSQEQLHLHMDCLNPDVYQWLKTAKFPGSLWIKGATYRAWKAVAKSNEFINPFQSLHQTFGNDPAALKKHALVLVTRDLADGSREFVVIDGDSGIQGGGSADLLMDRHCNLINWPL